MPTRRPDNPARTGLLSPEPLPVWPLDRIFPCPGAENREACNDGVIDALLHHIRGRKEDDTALLPDEDRPHAITRMT